MNKHIQNYLNSFKIKKEYWITFLIDAGFLGIMFLVFSFFGNLIKEKAYQFSQGKTAEQIQQMLLSMEPGQAEAFLANLKGFITTFVIGAIVILIGGLLIYSLSNKLVWGYLTEKKFSKTRYWRWNLLNLALIIPAIIYFFVFGLVRLVSGYAVSLLKNQTVLEIFYNLTNLFFLFILIIFVFMVYYSFVKEYKVWGSIGNACNLVKTKWKEIWPMFLLILGTAIALSLVLWPAGRLLIYRQGILIGVNVAVSLLFLAWMRLYVFKTVKE